jgi:plastocyanin
MRRHSLTLTLVPALLLAAGCDSTSSNGRILLQDDCDPATFNATLGAGTCQHRSAAGVTLSAFNAELQATHQVAAWRIFPSSLTVREGESLDVDNTGGETHTYTEVEEFGGGAVPALNTAAGITTVAPECLDGAEFSASTVRSGQTMQHTFDEKGTEKYQCCIHPWMRQTVTVQ